MKAKGIAVIAIGLGALIFMINRRFKDNPNFKIVIEPDVNYGTNNTSEPPKPLVSKYVKYKTPGFSIMKSEVFAKRYNPTTGEVISSEKLKVAQRVIVYGYYMYKGLFETDKGVIDLQDIPGGFSVWGFKE